MLSRESGYLGRPRSRIMAGHASEEVAGNPEGCLAIRLLRSFDCRRGVRRLSCFFCRASGDSRKFSKRKLGFGSSRFAAEFTCDMRITWTPKEN